MKLEGKLELTWVGKNEEIKLEPRILVEDKSKSYGDPNTENMLIHGDNLLALKALEKDFAGKIKCIYIDPPYNTGSAFEYYDDGLEHSQWLCMMKPRLEILCKLLCDEGAIFIQIDDNEGAYLKVLCDEIFGRKNFISSISLKMSTASGVKTSHREKTIIKEKETILVYAKNSEEFRIKPQYIPVREWDNEFQYYLEKNNSNNPENWKVLRLFDVLKDKNLSLDITDKKTFEFISKNKNNIWRRAFIRNEYKKLSQDNPNTIYYVKEGDHYYYRGREMFFLSSKYHTCLSEDGYREELSNLLGDFWVDINTGKLFNEGGIEFRNGKKPEFLISRILDMVTSEGDIVLDSFLGSGTTSAVAHKMNRKWIGIEMGEHAYSLAKTRLDNVIKGVDKSGMSKAFGWCGGGGYKFYELAESLLVKNDKLPVYQLNPNYTFEMICEAICKIEGFDYRQEGSFHGMSSENRFIHITKEFVNAEYVKNLSKELSEKQSLLIYSTKVETGLRLPKNITVKKIPKDLLEKCKFESEVR